MGAPTPNRPLGQISDDAVTDPDLEASVISLLKGIVSLGGGGGGGAAITIADGADATQGAKADAAAATDTSTASLISLFKRQLQRMTALIGLLPAALTGSGNFKVAVQEGINYTKTVNGSFTRPNDTTQYASGDVVSDSTSAPTVITFANVGRVANGSGTVTGAVLADSANQASKGSFELWLFDTTVTPDNDNAVFTPTDSELATFVGVLPLVTPYVGDATSGAGGNCVYMSDLTNFTFTCTGGGTSLFGVLVVRNAYTPVAQEVFTVRLQFVQD